MLANLQLNWLRTFEAVGRHLSFSLAARELNMTQSAVSQQIRLLEHKLGQPLFQRQTRAVQLTVTGRAYLGAVRDGLQRLEQGTDSIFRSAAQGVLELSVNNSFAQLWLAPRLAGFIARYPQLQLRIYAINWEADWPAGRAELEIRYGAGRWPELDALQLLSRELRPYCSLPLASRAAQSGGLASVPLIDVLGTPSGWRDWFARHAGAQDAGLQRLYVDGYAVAVSMALEHVGVCLLPDELVRGSRLQAQLVSPDERTIATQSTFYLVSRHNRPLSAAAQTFRDWLLAECGAG